MQLKFDEEELLTKNSGKLSLFKKICFAVGGLPYQMCGNALGLFIQPFLLEVAEVRIKLGLDYKRLDKFLFFKIRPSQVSIVLFSGRGWDAITDPLIGFLVNRTNTRFGKLRPWYKF